MEAEEIIPMDNKLHPIGTLMSEDSIIPSGDANWTPHRNIWRVIKHCKCQEAPNAPVRLACSIELVRQEPKETCYNTLVEI